MYKRMTKSAYNRPVWHRRGCVSILDTRDAFSPLLHSAAGRAHRSALWRACQFSTRFFSPLGSSCPSAPSPYSVLETHFYPEQFRRLLLTFLSPDRRMFHCARARIHTCLRAYGAYTRVHAAAVRCAIHFLFHMYFFRPSRAPHIVRH